MWDNKAQSSDPFTRRTVRLWNVAFKVHLDYSAVGYFGRKYYQFHVWILSLQHPRTHEHYTDSTRPCAFRPQVTPLQDATQTGAAHWQYVASRWFLILNAHKTILERKHVFISPMSVQYIEMFAAADAAWTVCGLIRYISQTCCGLIYTTTTM